MGRNHIRPIFLSMNILAIESSCDETAAAICIDGEILNSVVLSQEIHTQFGGVVPEYASREHDSQIHRIVDTALEKAALNLTDLDAIAVTYGAGLAGALHVGLNYAKGLSIGLNIPFVGVNHLEGHLYASFLAYPDLKYPYLCFLVTGGHTQIWEVTAPGDYTLHSNTVDDAAGEAFDKGARILGLTYPGGPEIEKLAKHGNTQLFPFPVPVVKSQPMNFSFSGLKTALLYKSQKLDKDYFEENKAHIAAGYQDAIINTLLNRLEMVIEKTGLDYISITGGVAANKAFRQKADILAEERNLHFYFPPIKYCTDNAAMIAIAGYHYIKAGTFSNLELQANPNLALNDTLMA